MPVVISGIIKLLKSTDEPIPSKLIILDLLKNLFCANEKVLNALKSPVCDTYMVLLRMLIKNPKIEMAMRNPNKYMTANIRSLIQLQTKAKDLINFVFELRRPSIIREFSCLGAASTLLAEQNLAVPSFSILPDLIAFFDDFNEIEDITPEMIYVDDFILVLKDL